MAYLEIRKQCGATAVEFIVAIPFFLILLFAILEVSYVYRAKSTLNSATFDAVRSGTLHNASKKVMRDVLANGMMPQFVDSDKSATGIAKAYGKSRLFERSLNGAAIGKISTVNIISPNKAIFNAFKKDIPVLNEKKQRFKYVKAIPNDNLQFRNANAKLIRIAGKRQKINIQDANLLKIKTFWCHRLRVPGLKTIAQRTVLEGIWGVFRVSEEQRSCNILGKINGENYVAISSHSIMRMQTPVFDKDLI